MKNTIFAISIFLLPLISPQQVFSQERVIEGQVLDRTSGEPLPYATISNISSGKGTISNIDGYFRLNLVSSNDSIAITYIGFQPQRLMAVSGRSFYKVLLQESSLNLNEVAVYGYEIPYLYKLVAECRKSRNNSKSAAKAYFELKSYINNEQVELLENFYNVALHGYDVRDMKIKTGRLALREVFGNRFFLSLNTSSALSMYRPLQADAFFPQNPLHFSANKMRKNFKGKLLNKYRNAQNDSIYVLLMTPRKSNGHFFETQLWINKTRKQIIKVHLSCPNAAVHPFVAVFSADKITKVALDITLSYEQQQGGMIFSQNYFTYSIDYQSRNSPVYTVTTHAVLQAYDYNHTFYLPKLEIAAAEMGDYRSINAIPYNSFFWKYNDELKLHDRENSNEAFFSDERSFTNKTIFTWGFGINNGATKGLFLHPYVTWSAKKRVRFADATTDTVVNDAFKPQFVADKFNLGIKIFLDVNRYADSVNFLSVTIIDPFETYYRLPQDPTAICFLNMYFDLVEIERRQLEAAVIASDKSPETIDRLYNDWLTRHEATKKEFIKYTERGHNTKNMQKWNEYILQQLDIDNLMLFSTYGR